MSKGMLGAAGGLSAADREKLIPENIREGIVLFEGTPRQIVGTLYPAPEKGTFEGYTTSQGVSEMLGDIEGLGIISGGILLGGGNEVYSGLTWFINKLDFSKYSSIEISVSSPDWEVGNSFSFLFGVGKTTNYSEWLKSQSVVANASPKQAILNISEIKDFGYIKFQVSHVYSQRITRLTISK